MRKHFNVYKFWLIASVALSLIFGLGIWWYTRWSLYLVWLMTSGLLTFFFYAYDKLAATSRALRIPNIILNGLSLVGGFVGGWLGMIVFRHKKSQIVYIVVLMVATLIHAWLIMKFYSISFEI